MDKRNSQGFSLAELLIAVAIITMLATMGGTYYNNFATHARYGRAKSEMAGFSTLVQGYRVTVDKTLIQIMPNPLGACEYCFAGCAPGGKPSTCDLVKALPYFKAVGYDAVPIDPWGNPYIVDQNELETGPGDCRHDAIWTAGADGIWEGPGGKDSVLPDDLIFRVPFYRRSNCTGGWDNLEVEGGL